MNVIESHLTADHCQHEVQKPLGPNADALQSERLHSMATPRQVLSVKVQL